MKIEYREFYNGSPTEEHLENLNKVVSTFEAQGKDSGALPPGKVHKVWVRMRYEILPELYDDPAFQEFVAEVDNNSEKVAELLFKEGYRPGDFQEGALTHR